MTHDVECTIAASDHSHGTEPHGCASRIAMVGAAPFVGECLAFCIASTFSCVVARYRAIEDMPGAGQEAGFRLVLVHDQALPHGGARRALVARLSRQSPLVVVSEQATLADVLEDLRAGSRGHVPVALGLNGVMTAIRRVLEGALFIPESGDCAAAEAQGDSNVQLTSRQKAIVRALAAGAPNKIIASDLAMSENTVKVHIHNIMKKLNVRNRTEIALKAQSGVLHC